MRLRFLRRLVDGKSEKEWLDEMSSYKLMQNWMHLVRLEERYSNARLITTPAWYLFRRPFVNVETVRNDIASLWKLIGKRYDGVIKQWLDRRVGAQLPNAADRVAQAFKDARTGLASRSDFREVPVHICRAMVFNLGNDAPVERKLLLRAFVDETPATEARGVLKSAAYGYASQGRIGTTELRELFDRGCVALHESVLACGEIDRWTDGRITPADAASATAHPPATYEQWLML